MVIPSSDGTCYYHIRESGNNLFPEIPLSYQTLYAEVAQRALDAAFSSDFSTDGRFIRQESRGRYYWYFDRNDAEGKKKRSYVGPVDDPEITKRVETFKSLKADIRARRKLVSTLVREAYLMPPEQKSGLVVQAVAEAGFFRLRGVLVGTLAYQAYSSVLGVRLPNTATITADADFAQFHAVSSSVEDEIDPLLDKLKEIDPTFRAVPHMSDGRFSTQIVANDGYRLDFLTPNSSSDDYTGHPAQMPALNGMAAEPLRFLDYLISEPIRAVLLHGSGIPVLVPAPERFAIHKLIVASRRLSDDNGLGKSRKDRVQATTLISALTQTRRVADVADSFMEAWDRGSHWQEALTESLHALEPSDAALVTGTLTAGIAKLGGNPTEYGLATGDVPP